MKTIQKVVFLTVLMLAANSQAGRWISEDPIGFMERDPRPGDATFQEQLNLYRYVDNNPINMVDPFGLDGYLFFLANGGPDFATGAGHIGVGVDDGRGGVYRRDAAWDSLGPIGDFSNLNQAASQGEMVIRLPNHILPDGGSSDSAMRTYMRRGRTGGHLYTYCSNYASDVARAGGWDLPALTPNWMFQAALQMANTPVMPGQNPPAPVINPLFRLTSPGLR